MPAGPAPPAPARLIDLEAPRTGTCFEGELAAGSTHAYRFALEAGEYLHLVVDQLGVDVVVTLRGPPRGQPLLQVDAPTGKQGAEHLFLVAESSGPVGIGLRAFPGAEPGGRYQARFEALRPATSEDRRRARAARAFYDAERLEKEDSELAARHYRAAADAWRELGDATRQAAALAKLGSVAGRPQAIEAYERARILYHRLGDARGEALTLFRLGSAHRLSGSYERARQAYEASLGLWRELDLPKDEASTLNGLGLVAKKQGRFHDALEHYSQAIEILYHLGERYEQATALTNQGVYYSLVGQPRRAVEAHRRALALLDRRRDPPGQVAVSLNRLGDALLQLNETEEALERYAEALELRRRIGRPRGIAVSLNGIGMAYQQDARPQDALIAYQTALGILQEEGDGWAQATVLNNLGSLYEMLGQSARALESFEEALELARSRDHHNAKAAALLGLARVARHQARWPDAQDLVEKALSIYESLRATADGELRSTFLASRMRHYDFLVDLLADRHRRDPQAGFDAAAFEASERARARGLLESLSQVRARGTRGADPEALDRLDELRRKINALHLERLATAPPASGGHVAGRLDRELRTLFDRLQQEEARLRRDSPRWADLVDPRPVSLEQVRAELLDEETLLLEYFLGETRSFLWAVTRDRSAFYELADRETLERAALRAHTGMARSHLQTDELGARLAARELSVHLLEPVATLLPERSRLLIVAPGALQLVPFAALPDPSVRRGTEDPREESQPLVIRHEIVSLPSVSVLAALRRQIAGRPPAPELAALLADPVFDPGDERLRAANGAGSSPAPPSSYPPRLPHSRTEAESILALAGRDNTLQAFGFDASLELVRSGRLARYRILHFATHGELDAQNPELSSMVLSLFDRDGRRVDGHLRTYEIFNLDLPADLVVLSACRTALGRQVHGEGLVGLTRAFMYAGAAQVAVSLWAVSDRATAELMHRFYGFLLHERLPPDRALRRAQVSMWREARWQAPYYWAGFVLQGDWRAFERPSN